ncbi:MAG: hypothetical protein EOO67_02615 [Microbacterium sp.]|nr:MAG: hypothetical protein EOO67_02615 [Microbacterium sp.]
MDDTNPTPDVNGPLDIDEVPSADLPGSSDQPETQGADPVVAELGEDGEGDLAPGDLGPGDMADGHDAVDDGPTDLRTELPAEGS